MSVVFVDRDGVINRLVERDGGRYSPLTFESFSLIDGVETAIKHLADHGFQIVVVTNQPDISRGKLLMLELTRMHTHLLTLPIAEVLCCPHDSEEYCNCRKPNTALMMQFLNRTPHFPKQLWMVGDRDTDLLAGKRIGASTIWISGGQQTYLPPRELADFQAPSLVSAARIICANKNSE